MRNNWISKGYYANLTTAEERMTPIVFASFFGRPFIIQIPYDCVCHVVAPEGQTEFRIFEISGQFFDISAFRGGPYGDGVHYAANALWTYSTSLRNPPIAGTSAYNYKMYVGSSPVTIYETDQYGNRLEKTTVLPGWDTRNVSGFNLTSKGSLPIGASGYSNSDVAVYDTFEVTESTCPPLVIYHHGLQQIDPDWDFTAPMLLPSNSSMQAGFRAQEAPSWPDQFLSQEERNRWTICANCVGWSSDPVNNIPINFSSLQYDGSVIDAYVVLEPDQDLYDILPPDQRGEQYYTFSIGGRSFTYTSPGWWTYTVRNEEGTESQTYNLDVGQYYVDFIAEDMTITGLLLNELRGWIKPIGSELFEPNVQKTPYFYYCYEFGKVPTVPPGGLLVRTITPLEIDKAFPSPFWEDNFFEKTIFEQSEGPFEGFFEYDSNGQRYLNKGNVIGYDIEYDSPWPCLYLTTWKIQRDTSEAGDIIPILIALGIYTEFTKSLDPTFNEAFEAQVIKPERRYIKRR